jgi:hypothetical protein
MLKNRADQQHDMPVLRVVAYRRAACIAERRESIRTPSRFGLVFGEILSGKDGGCGIIKLSLAVPPINALSRIVFANPSLCRSCPISCSAKFRKLVREKHLCRKPKLRNDRSVRSFPFRSLWLGRSRKYRYGT